MVGKTRREQRSSDQAPSTYGDQIHAPWSASGLSERRATAAAMLRCAKARVATAEDMVVVVIIIILCERGRGGGWVCEKVGRVR